MSDRNDGGPAFPQDTRKTENYMDQGGYGRSRVVTVTEGGMSLRDYFAGQALAGLLANPTTQEWDSMAQTVEELTEACALMAYKQADAMLAERDRA